MTDTQQRTAAKQFAEFWKDKGYEKGESQSFWLSLLRDVYGVEHPEQFITFEEQVHLDHTSFIDGTILSTRVLIEQKGLGKDLKKPIRQSDGTLLTPFNQAKRYITELPLSQHPRWVVTCNFSTFFVYDMERPGGEPEEILLENLPTEYYRLSFLVDSGNENLKREMEVSITAGEIVGLLYDAFSKQYVDPTSERAMKSLNVLCVRLVFCLYAEDAGIFGHHGMFYDYLTGYDTKHTRKALMELFKVLDTKPEERDPYMEEELAAFPYVNGGLFANEDIEIPQFTDEIRDLLLEKASSNFDWSEISPTIFGAVFESTLNPETRRSGGMHYTSIENIHKVIDPLFLDGLNAEFESICTIGVEKTRDNKLSEFQKKLANLNFFDPACGSGNFLTETYISLRRLENKVLMILYRGQLSFGDESYNPIQVSIGQFYGIEINDFAVTVAKTALWIAESQMMKETEGIVLMHLDFLPLKSYSNIIEDNALRRDWETVAPKSRISYVMGNPPFSGGMKMDEDKKRDMKKVIGANTNGVGEMDYVVAWYYLAAKYISNTKIECAFVSTNSIIQGQQAITVWEPLITEKKVIINFAYRTFKWNNESSEVAAVHCVIIGFSLVPRTTKIIIDESGHAHTAENINSYLVNAENWFVHAVSAPIWDVPAIKFGSMPRGKAFIMSAEEREEIVNKYPFADKFIRKFYMGNEFIKGNKRFCLWLVGANPAELKKCPPITKRIEEIRAARLESKAIATQKLAGTPTLFAQIAQPDRDYIAVPAVSSENRRYIPIGFLPKETIAGNKLYIIPDGKIYHFGVITSNVHMAWMRMFAGRLESRYSYSKDIVYNNFPWPTPTDVQKAKIEQTAQAILDARALYQDSSLADLYDEVLMPPELRRAHQQNDRAVMQAYGFSIKDTTESSCILALMKLYEQKTAGK